MFLDCYLLKWMFSLGWLVANHLHYIILLIVTMSKAATSVGFAISNGHCFTLRVIKSLGYSFSILVRALGWDVLHNLYLSHRA